MGGTFFVDHGVKGEFKHDLEWLSVSQLASGYHLRVPVITVEGNHSGPTLGITAGVHGDEHTGTEIIRRLLT